MTKLILASNSPRRKKIMSDLGLNFEVISSNYESRQNIYHTTIEEMEVIIVEL